jgi:putative endonuclease
MKKNNKVTGNKGEEIAAKYLENKGYLLVERNFRTRFGEIDIVCWDGPILVFVEVKTKIGHDFGEPEDMVNKSKLAQVERMGEVFIEMSGFIACDSNQSLDCHPADSYAVRRAGVGIRNDEMWKGQCRVDVVAIVLFENGEIESIKHHEAVY